MSVLTHHYSHAILRQAAGNSDESFLDNYHIQSILKPDVASQQTSWKQGNWKSSQKPFVGPGQAPSPVILCHWQWFLHHIRWASVVFVSLHTRSCQDVGLCKKTFHQNDWNATYCPFVDGPQIWTRHMWLMRICIHVSEAILVKR